MGTQIEMPLLQRIEGPAVVPPALVAKASTFRQAVRLCWGLRRVKWTPAALSAHYGSVSVVTYAVASAALTRQPSSSNSSRRKSQVAASSSMTRMCFLLFVIGAEN